ncbi:MAG: exopolysaccharide biosynthesis protein [Cellvibrio sp.]
MPASEPDPHPSDQQGSTSLSSLLAHYAQGLQEEHISIRDILESLGNRSFGFVLFLFALPNSLPIIGIPGVSTITGIPILFVALQMAFGYERVYLPRWIADRSMATADFKQLVERATPWIQKIERLMRPRGDWLISDRVEPLLGLICSGLAFLLILPIPLGNLFPAFAIVLIALGLIERDGLFVMFGVAVGALSGFVLGGLVLVALHTFYDMFQQFIT